jgi:hypothetical protein
VLRAIGYTLVSFVICVPCDISVFELERKSSPRSKDIGVAGNTTYVMICT